MKFIPDAQVRTVPVSVRAVMEQLFGDDFRDVWIITGAAPEALGARAFAYGNAVFMSSEDAALDNPDRWGLLAHELTHVIQQRSGRLSASLSRDCLELYDARLEREADVMCERARRLFGRSVPESRVRRARPRSVARPVIQCVMKLDKFQEQTKARTPRALDRISSIDSALKRFHELDAVKAKDYTALAQQAKALHQAARKFLDDKPDANRRDPVAQLSRQIAIEGAFLDLLAQYEEESDEMTQFKLLEKAQEFVRRNIVSISEARHASPEINDLINKHTGAMGTGSQLVLRDIEKLKKIVDDPTLPGILKSVILEATSSANLQQIDTANMTPGLKYNKTRGPGLKKYTLNHNMAQYLGRRFRMGSLLHELTHLSNAEIFDNTVLILSIHKAATDAEITALASQRRGSLLALKAEIEKSSAVSGELKSELVGKVGYPIMGKFASYLAAFKSQVDPAVHARLTTLQRGGLDCELIEYDSVVNQMMLWCHLFSVDRGSALYTKLESMVVDAYRYRQTAKVRKKPLPAVPVRVVAARPTVAPRKPLPALPVGR